MPESAVAEAPVAPAQTPAPVAAEPSPTFDTAQLDALLESMSPAKGISLAPDAPQTDPVAPPAAPGPPVAPKAPEAPVAPEPPVAPKPPINPFDPPASVMGEKVEAGPDEIDTKYPDFPEEPPANFKTKESKEGWKVWKKSHSELKAELKKIHAESRKAPTPDAAAAAQIAELTNRVQELNQIVETTAVERHPWVKQNFDAPRKGILDLAKKDLENISIDPRIMEKVISLTGKERIEAMGELHEAIDNPYVRDKITQAISQIDLIDAKKAEFLADRKGVVEQMTQAQKAEQYRQVAEQEQKMTQAVQQTIDRVTNEFGFEFLKEASEPGTEKWNERVKNDKALINELALKNTDPQKLLTAITLGVQAPHYRAAWQNERQLRLAAESKVAEYEGTLPKLGGEKTPAEPAGATGDSELDAAGILPTDNLQVMAEKLGRYRMSRQ